MSQHYSHFDHASKLTSPNNGLTRSATLSSHNKNISGNNLQRSVSVSTQVNDNNKASTHSSVSSLSKNRKKVKSSSIESSSHLFSRPSGSLNEPWEMYFDPNYTFFGGTVLERRKNRQQQDVLQAMALQDQHLHLHPPPSHLNTAMSEYSPSMPAFSDQPTLPLAVMNAVHFQLYNDQIQVNSNLSDDENDLGLQQNAMPTHEHHARLALLQAIRTETYHKSTFSSAGTNGHTLSASAQPRTTSLRWVEKKVEALKCQTSSSATLNLATLQDSNRLPPDEKSAVSPLMKRIDATATKTMPAKNLSTPPKKTPQCRLSFLYFVFGFLFPPVWIIGALYTPPEKKYQSSKGRRIDLMWKRACRLAFGLFVFALLILLVAILALNPGALGWRTSRSDQNSAQKFIPVVQPASMTFSYH